MPNQTDAPNYETRKYRFTQDRVHIEYSVYNGQFSRKSKLVRVIDRISLLRLISLARDGMLRRNVLFIISLSVNFVRFTTGKHPNRNWKSCTVEQRNVTARQSLGVDLLI